MQRKDLLEIKKRFKKNECTFTRMTGCYVNATKEKVTSFSNVFLNLPDEEYYKYLEIAKNFIGNDRKPAFRAVLPNGRRIRCHEQTAVFHGAENKCLKG